MSSIRLVKKEELPRLVEKAREMFLDAFGEAYKREPAFEDYVNSAFTLQKFEEEWKEASTRFWLMTANNQWIGYAKIRMDVLPDCIDSGRGMEIKRFYLDQAYHGKGYAQQLMDHCLELAQKNSCNILWLGVWPQNAKAIRFYKKYDFEFCGKVMFRLGEKVEWDKVMKKEIELTETLHE